MLEESVIDACLGAVGCNIYTEIHLKFILIMTHLRQVYPLVASCIFLLNLYLNSPYFPCMLYALTFERVEEFKYLGTTLTYQNSIAEEIKSRLRSGNACYHSVQNLLSSRLLSKNLKIKIYRTIILPVVLYGCETWSLTLREERKLWVFEIEENIWTEEGRGNGGMEEIA